MSLDTILTTCQRSTTLDGKTRSEGLGFDSQCWPCVEMSGKLRIPHASVHPVVMGTWCTDPRLDQ